MKNNNKNIRESYLSKLKDYFIKNNKFNNKKNLLKKKNKYSFSKILPHQNKYIINSRLKNDFQNKYVENINENKEILICENFNEILRLISKKYNFFKMHIYKKKTPLKIELSFSPEVYDFYVYLSFNENFKNQYVYKNTKYITINKNSKNFDYKYCYIKIWIIENCFCEIITNFGVLKKNKTLYIKKKKQNSYISEEINKFKEYINVEENFKDIIKKRELKYKSKNNSFIKKPKHYLNYKYNINKVNFNKKQLYLKMIKNKNFVVNKRNYENELYNIYIEINNRINFKNYMIENWVIILKIFNLFNNLQKMNNKLLNLRNNSNKNTFKINYFFNEFKFIMLKKGSDLNNRNRLNTFYTLKLKYNIKKNNNKLICNFFEKLRILINLRNKLMFKGKIYFNIQLKINFVFKNHKILKNKILKKYKKIYYILSKKYNIPNEIIKSFNIILKYFLKKYYQNDEKNKFRIEKKYIYNFYKNYYNLY